MKEPEFAHKITVKKKKVFQKIFPAYLFGKWKNLDIYPKKIREEAWGRNHKYF